MPLATATEAKTPAGQRAALPTLKSLSTFASGLQSFMTSDADPSKAKEFNSVVSPVFFGLALDQVNYSMVMIFSLHLYYFCRLYGAREL